MADKDAPQNAVSPTSPQFKPPQHRCPHCGFDSRTEVDYCPRCAKGVHWPVAPTTASLSLPTPQQAPPQQAPPQQAPQTQQVQQQHAQQPAPVRKPAPAQTPSSGSSCLSNTILFLVVGYIGIHALPLLMLVFTHFMFFGLMAWAVFLMFIMVYAASRR